MGNSISECSVSSLEKIHQLESNCNSMDNEDICNKYIKKRNDNYFRCKWCDNKCLVSSEYNDDDKNKVDCFYDTHLSNNQTSFDLRTTISNDNCPSYCFYHNANNSISIEQSIGYPQCSSSGIQHIEILTVVMFVLLFFIHY